MSNVLVLVVSANVEIAARLETNAEIVVFWMPMSWFLTGLSPAHRKGSAGYFSGAWIPVLTKRFVVPLGKPIPEYALLFAYT